MLEPVASPIVLPCFLLLFLCSLAVFQFAPARRLRYEYFFADTDVVEVFGFWIQRRGDDDAFLHSFFSFTQLDFYEENK